MRKLKGIHLKGYKAIEDIGLTNLAGINYFVGPNGCGKSSIFEALSIPSAFIKRGSAGGNTVSTYGDLKRIVHNGFLLELMFDDDAINEISLSITDHHNLTVHDGNLVRRYPEGNPTRDSGLHSQDWVSNILDMNATDEEASIDIKTKYTFDLDNAEGADDIKDFLNKHYAKNGEHVRNVVRSITAANTIEFEITSEEDKSKTLRHESLRSVSSGYLQLLALYFSMKRRLGQFADHASSNNKVAIVCIEEPGQGLHPGLQKKLPELFCEMLEDIRLSNVVLLITTHSPFIISAACSYKDQKTYLIREGHAVNLAGDIDNKSSGYNSDKCLNVAASMLDAGFEDIAAIPSTKESLQVVYCEGESKKVKDSDIYSEIFRDEPVRRLFISTGGYNDAKNAYYAARATVKFVFGEGSSAVALLDRSCSSDDTPISPGEVIGRTTPQKPLFADVERKKILNSDAQKGYECSFVKKLKTTFLTP